MANVEENAATSKDAERAFIQDAIHAEVRAVERLVTLLGPEVHDAVALMESCGSHVVTSGMGKSGLIAQKISATLSSIGVPSHFLHPAEAVHGDLGRIRRDDLLWAWSYSGNTDEVVTLASLVRADDIPVIGVSSNPQSRLAAISDVHLNIGDVTEACPMNLAPTASTTAMLVLGDVVGLAVSRRRNFTESDYRKRHPGGMLGMGLRPITDLLRFRVDENLPLIRDNTTVGDALAQADVGRRPGAMILIDDQGKMTGIFTDGDLRRLILEHGVKALDQPMASVMTRHPRHLTTSHLLRDTVQLVREHRQDEIPVVDDEGRPVGMIDVQDLVSLKIIEG